MIYKGRIHTYTNNSGDDNIILKAGEGETLIVDGTISSSNFLDKQIPYSNNGTLEGSDNFKYDYTNDKIITKEIYSENNYNDLGLNSLTLTNTLTYSNLPNQGKAVSLGKNGSDFWMLVGAGDDSANQDSIVYKNGVFIDTVSAVTATGTPDYGKNVSCNEDFTYLTVGNYDSNSPLSYNQDYKRVGDVISLLGGFTARIGYVCKQTGNFIFTNDQSSSIIDAYDISTLTAYVDIGGEGIGGSTVNIYDVCGGNTCVYYDSDEDLIKITTFDGVSTWAVIQTIDVSIIGTPLKISCSNLLITIIFSGGSVCLVYSRANTTYTTLYNTTPESIIIGSGYTNLTTNGTSIFVSGSVYIQPIRKISGTWTKDTNQTVLTGITSIDSVSGGLLVGRSGEGTYGEAKFYTVNEIFIGTNIVQVADLKLSKTIDVDLNASLGDINITSTLGDVVINPLSSYLQFTYMPAGTIGQTFTVNVNELTSTYWDSANIVQSGNDYSSNFPTWDATNYKFIINKEGIYHIYSNVTFNNNINSSKGYWIWVVSTGSQAFPINFIAAGGSGGAGGGSTYISAIANYTSYIEKNTELSVYVKSIGSTVSASTIYKGGWSIVRIS